MSDHVQLMALVTVYLIDVSVVVGLLAAFRSLDRRDVDQRSPPPEEAEGDAPGL